MNDEKMIKIAAEFMALLLVMIPFCVSDAYAQNQPHIEVTEFEGEHGIEGYIHTMVAGNGDTLDVEVEAFYPSPSGGSDVIEGDQIRLYVSGTPMPRTPFEDADCVLTLNNTYKCTTSFDFDWASGIRTYEFKLYSDAEKSDSSAQEAASDAKVLVVDVIGAAMIYVNISTDRVADDELDIIFGAEDYAINEGQTSHCVGVETVKLYLDQTMGTPIAVFTFDPGTCEAEGSYTYDIHSLSEGDYRICAVATDFFGQTIGHSGDCKDFSLDNTPPTVLLDTVRIVDDDDNDIEYVNDVEQNADIFINLDGADIVQSSIRADFSNLAGPTMNSVSPNFIARLGAGGEYALKWINVGVKNVQTCLIGITAVDTSGNTLDVNIPCNVGYDTTGPVVNEIVTTAIKDGIYYVTANSKVVAKMTEAGAGLDDKKVYLDLSSVTGQSRRQADNCTNVGGSSWECYWTVGPTSNIGIFNIAVSKESMDDIGNIMDATYRQDIGVDQLIPVVNANFNTTHVGGTNSVGPGIFVNGDTLEIVIEVSDAAFATANLSGVGGDEDALPSDCWDENDKVYCLWEVQIQGSGPFSNQISFTFTDFVGNSAPPLFVGINVSAIDDDPTPDYWYVDDMSCYPEIDRQMSLQTPGGYKTYCNAQLETPYAATALIYRMEMPNFALGCTVDEVNEGEVSESITTYFNDIRLVNSFRGSTTPYFSMNLVNADFEDVGTITITCQLNIFTEREIYGGTEFTVHPEIEQMTMTLEFYNDPAGELGDELESTIESHIEKINELEAWGAGLYEYILWGQRLCALQQSLTNIHVIFTAVTNLFKAASETYKPLTAAWTVMCEGQVKSGETWGKVEDFLDKFCAFVNCKYSDALKDKNSQTMRRVVTGEYLGQTLSSFDPKESIFWSVATLCLPGIIYNLNKLQEVECVYVYCVMSGVGDGLPLSLCEDIYSLQTCTFWTGQIFNLIPIVQVYSQFMTRLQSLVSDPLVLLGWVLTMFGVCSRDKCNEGSGRQHFWCSMLYAFSMVGKIMEDYERMTDTDQDYWETGAGYCQMLADDYSAEVDLIEELDIG